MSCSAQAHRFSKLLELALLLLASVLVISACSAPGRSYTENGMTETLETEILTNGSKMFVYRLRRPDDQVPSHIQVVHSRGTPERYQRQGVEINRRTYEHIRANAEFVVAKMGYCRRGYLELDGSVSRYHMWLKGECRESATAEDRVRFPEPQVLPVKSS